MRRVLSAAVVSAVLLLGYMLAVRSVGTTGSVPADDVSTPAAEASAPVAQRQTPPAAMGMTAVLDDSGQRYVQRGIDPANGGLDPAISDTSTEGLRLEQDPDNRGFYMNLQGRFQCAIVATIDDEGNLSTDCVETIPAAMNGHVGRHGHAGEGDSK